MNHSGAVFVLAKRNYKVYADVSITVRETRQFIDVIDTRTGSSFVRHDELSPEVRKSVQPLTEEVNIRNGSGKQIQIIGNIQLTVQIGTVVEQFDSS